MTRRLLPLTVFLCLLAALAGCTNLESALRAAGYADDGVPPPPPVMRWDHRPEAPLWTAATFRALEGHGAVLPALVPADIDTWCPAYAEASLEERRAFWTGLLSALAKHESTWNPVAVGGGGRWFGLVQIDPRTARGYGCKAQSGNALKDGEDNLSCAVRIAAHQVADRGTVDRGMRDWGPFHSSAKRADMAAWTRAQSYCRG